MKQSGINRYRSLIVVAAPVLVGLVVVAVLADPAGAQHGGPITAWAVHLRRMDGALAEKNAAAATKSWQAAYRAAVRSGSWAAMLEVGEAYLRIGEVGGDRKAVQSQARQIYLTALSRARRQESFDGVLQIAEAFARLGDDEMVEQSIETAKLFAASDPEAEADLRAFLERMADQARGHDP